MSIASAYRTSISCWDGPTSWCAYRRNAHRLERVDCLLAQLRRRIERRLREVAALVEGRRVVSALEEEVFELRPDVERVEAHLLHALDGSPQDVARVAFVGLSVRRDDVADHPPHLRAVALGVGHELEGRRIGIATMSDSSMALKPVIDEPSKPMPSSSASSISEGGSRSSSGDLEVGEPQEDEVDALLLDSFEDTASLRRIARRPVLSSLPSASSLLL